MASAQRGGVVESERDASQDADLGVGGFDQSLGQAVVEGGVDGVAVFDDAAGQLDEDWDAAAPRPRDPPVEGLFTVLPFDREHMPQALFQQGCVSAGRLQGFAI